MATSVLTIMFLLMPAVCYCNQDRVRLQDLQAITLHQGRYTSARRSHAVPQLQCMGGTAGCSAYVPQVVQCYNRGFDGYDVQWECKTDMDNAYRFGQIAVNCEGFDYPDDPYISRGSCGLEYYLELTKEGYQQHHSSNQNAGYTYQKTYRSENGVASTFVNVVMFVIALIVIGSVVYMCWSHPHQDAPPPYPGPPGYSMPPPGYPEPPPAGFRSDFMPSSSQSGNCSYQPGCGYESSHRSAGTGAGGGFWSGAATGGILGYLLGSRGQARTYTHQAPYQPPQPTNSWWSSGSPSDRSQWGSSSTSFSSSSSASTGTRTASGFGGTKRR